MLFRSSEAAGLSASSEPPGKRAHGDHRDAGPGKTIQIHHFHLRLLVSTYLGKFQPGSPFRAPNPSVYAGKSTTKRGFEIQVPILATETRTCGGMPPAARLVDATRPRDAAPAAIVRMQRFNRKRESARENLPPLGDPPKSLRKKRSGPEAAQLGER